MFETQSHTLQPEQPAPDAQVLETLGNESPVVTLWTIGLNVAVFFVMVARGVAFVSPTAAQVLPWGANYGPLTLSGQWLRLLTACYLHFGIIHIAMNMYILLQVGPFAERLFGKARYLALYLLAGIGGNIAGLYIHPHTVSAGASGAIFGIYGGILGFLLVRRGVVPAERAQAIVKSAGIFLAYNMIYGLAHASTDLTAHIGGLVVGFGVGCLLAWAGAGETKRLLTASVLLAAVTIGSAVRVPQNSRFEKMRPSVTVGTSDHVVYSGSATQKDAEALGKALVATGVLRDKNVTVLLRKDAGKTTLSISLRGDETLSPTYDDVSSKLVDGKTVEVHTTKTRPPLPWNNPAFLSYLNQIGPVLAASLGGPPLTIELTNQKGEPRRDLTITGGAVIVGDRDSIAYLGMATAADAVALGKALHPSGFMNNQGTHVVLSKDAGGTVILFPIQDDRLQDPTLQKDMEAIGREVAPSVGGLPLTVRLKGTSGTTTKDIPIR